MPDLLPIRLRTAKRLLRDTAERRTLDRQRSAVNRLVAHVKLPINCLFRFPASCPRRERRSA
jgi:hypothetical protein